MAIDYFDEFGTSPTLDLGINHSRARREGIIPWLNILAFIAEIFPTSAGSEPASFPGFDFIKACGIHIEPFKGDKSKVTYPPLAAPIEPALGVADLDYDILNRYEYAKVVVDYETPTFKSESGDPVTLLSHRWTIGGEFLTIESAGLEWCDGSEVASDVTAGVLIPTIEHQISWPRVLKPPFAKIRELIGTCNKYEISFQTGPIYPETLLFLGAELNRDIKTDGSLAWEVSYRFSEKRVKVRKTGSGCMAPIDETECDAAGGLWVGGVCRDYAGGWNHFFRTDRTKSGFQRLQLHPDEDSPNTQALCMQADGLWDDGQCFLPIYPRRTHQDLFVEDL